MKRKPVKPTPDLVWLTCVECGNEQTDMGRNVACEVCGARMPEVERAREDVP